MNKDSFYFPHFYNARNDRKIRRLRKELGVEGYGIYFMVLEVLRDQKDFRYPVEDIDLLADEFKTSDQKVRVVICNYGLFEVDEDEFFFSPKFIEYLTPYLEAKQRNRVNGIKGNLIKHGHAKREELQGLSDEEIVRLNENRTDFSGGESGGDRKKSKVKERKVKESKGKSTIPTHTESLPYRPVVLDPPKTVEEVIQIGSMKGIKPEQCMNYFNMRSVDNFLRTDKMGNWKPIPNWHADLYHCYAKGYLENRKQYTNPNKNGNTTKPNKGDQHVQAIRDILHS